MGRFEEAMSKFKTRLVKLLGSSDPINDIHVKQVSVLLKMSNLHETNIQDYEAKVFMDNIRLYFVFLKSYVNQYETLSSSHCFTLRMGFQTFLIVVESINLKMIMNKLKRIVDVVLEENNSISEIYIKEVLRVYTVLLQKLPYEHVKKLALNQASFSALYKLLHDTSDIETETIILELVFLLLKDGDYSSIEESFRDLLQRANSSDHNENVATILNHVNENPLKDFSMKCKIEIDSHQMKNDIWLNVDLIQNRLIFFCDKHFVSLIHKVKIPSGFAWEMLAFSLDDVTRPGFVYSESDEILKISLHLKLSNSCIFVDLDSDTVHSVEITVTKNSEKFKDFVTKILPYVFPTFKVSNLEGVPCQDVDITPEIFSSSNSESSPVIEHFRNYNKESVIIIESDDDCDIVEILDEEEAPTKKISTFIPDCGTVQILDEVVARNKKISSFFRDEEKNQRALNSSNSVFNTSSTSFDSMHKPSRTENQVKISVLNPNGQTDAITAWTDGEPSFSESVFRPPSRNSTDRRTKISSLNQMLTSTPKVSTKFQALQPKLSASLYSEVVTEKRDSLSQDILENLLDQTLDDSLELSKNRVQTWLENQHKGKQQVEDIYLPPEESLALLMPNPSQRHDDASMVQTYANCTSPDLMKILASGDESQIVGEESLSKDGETNKSLKTNNVRKLNKRGKEKKRETSKGKSRDKSESSNIVGAENSKKHGDEKEKKGKTFVKEHKKKSKETPDKANEKQVEDVCVSANKDKKRDTSVKELKKKSTEKSLTPNVQNTTNLYGEENNVETKEKPTEIIDTLDVQNGTNIDEKQTDYTYFITEKAVERGDGTEKKRQTSEKHEKKSSEKLETSVDVTERTPKNICININLNAVKNKQNPAEKPKETSKKQKEEMTKNDYNIINVDKTKTADDYSLPLDLRHKILKKRIDKNRSNDTTDSSDSVPLEKRKRRIGKHKAKAIENDSNASDVPLSIRYKELKKKLKKSKRKEKKKYRRIEAHSTDSDTPLVQLTKNDNSVFFEHRDVKEDKKNRKEKSVYDLLKEADDLIENLSTNRSISFRELDAESEINQSQTAPVSAVAEKTKQRDFGIEAETNKYSSSSPQSDRAKSKVKQLAENTSAQMSKTASTGQAFNKLSEDLIEADILSVKETPKTEDKPMSIARKLFDKSEQFNKRKFDEHLQSSMKKKKGDVFDEISSLSGPDIPKTSKSVGKDASSVEQKKDLFDEIASLPSENADDDPKINKPVPPSNKSGEKSGNLSGKRKDILDSSSSENVDDFPESNKSEAKNINLRETLFGEKLTMNQTSKNKMLNGIRLISGNKTKPRPPDETNKAAEQSEANKSVMKEQTRNELSHTLKNNSLLEKTNTRNKRKLYNPGDFSFIQNDGYKSKIPEPSPEEKKVVIDLTKTRKRKADGKSTKEIKAKTKSERKRKGKKLITQKLDISSFEKKPKLETSNRKSNVFGKTYADTLSEVNERKKQKRIALKKKGLPSPASSLEHQPSFSKDKIHILSNVLIKAPDEDSQLETPTEHSHSCALCSRDMEQKTCDLFLQNVQHFARFKPEVLRTARYKKIVQVINEAAHS